MTSWNGEERRKQIGFDHDVLIRIDQKLSNVIEEQIEHKKENKIEFSEHDKRIKFLEKSYWMAVGIIVFVEIISKIIHV